MKTQEPPAAPYGFLLILRLLRRAAYDQRLTFSQLRALNLLASFSGQDCSCFVSTSTIARLLGVSRQAAQKALKRPEELGYFRSVRRYRANGGEISKIFILSQELADVDACLWPPPPPQADGVPLLSAKGEQPPDVAGRASSAGCGPMHPPEDAQRNPKEESLKEETKGPLPVPTRSNSRDSNRSTLPSYEIGAIGRPCDQIDGTSVTGQTEPARMQAQRRRSNNRFPSHARGATLGQGLQRLGFARGESWEQQQRNKALERINLDLTRQQGAMEEVFDALSGEMYLAALDAAVKAEMKRTGNGAKYLIAAAKNAQRNKVEG